jgi:GTP-binding protein
VYKEFLQKDWEEIPDSFVTSAEEKSGLEEILNFIETNNQIIPS